MSVAPLHSTREMEKSLIDASPFLSKLLMYLNAIPVKVLPAILAEMTHEELTTKPRAACRMKEPNWYKADDGQCYCPTSPDGKEA
jgi:hypothetical protein